MFFDLNPKIATQKCLEGCELVYLDQNIWIELRDGKFADAVNCRTACYAAFQRGTVLFPLSYSVVAEAIEISDFSTRQKHCQMLDDLSNSLIFLPFFTLRRLEASRVCDWLFDEIYIALTREEVFTTVFDYFDIKTVGLLESDVISVREVSFIAEQLDWKKAHAVSREQYIKQMKDVRIHNQSIPKNHRKAKERLLAIDRERKYLNSTYVNPLIAERIYREYSTELNDKDKKSSHSQLSAQERIQSFVSEKVEKKPKYLNEIFSRMPVMDQFAHLMAFDSLEVSRHPKPQDFHDFSHGAEPTIYCDVFVTTDGRLRDLVRNGGRYKAKILSSISELTSWLISH
jgi:hypothetical protein